MVTMQYFELCLLRIKVLGRNDNIITMHGFVYVLFWLVPYVFFVSYGMVSILGMGFAKEVTKGSTIVQ